MFISTSWTPPLPSQPVSITEKNPAKPNVRRVSLIGSAMRRDRPFPLDPQRFEDPWPGVGAEGLQEDMPKALPARGRSAVSPFPTTPLFGRVTFRPSDDAMSCDSNPHRTPNPNLARIQELQRTAEVQMSELEDHIRRVWSETEARVAAAAAQAEATLAAAEALASDWLAEAEAEREAILTAARAAAAAIVTAAQERRMATARS